MVDEQYDYSKFFELSHDLLCVAGADGYFKAVNSAFTRELGWSERKLLTLPIVDFVHPEDIEATQRELETLAEGLPSIRFENRYRHQDGGWRTMDWSAFLDRPTGLIYAVARIV